MKKSIKKIMSNEIKVLSLIHSFNVKGGDMKPFSQLSDEEKKRIKDGR